MVSTRAVMVGEISCSMSWVARTATAMSVWKSGSDPSSYWWYRPTSCSAKAAGGPIGEEDQNSNAAGSLEKYQINLDDDILPVIGTGKSSTLAWHHNFWHLMILASCGLEVSEIVLTGHRNPDRTNEKNTIRLPKCIKFWCLNRVSEDEIQSLFKVCHCLVQKGIILIP